MYISPVASISVGISRNKVEGLEKFSRPKCSLKKEHFVYTKEVLILITLICHYNISFINLEIELKK